jgi:hypothetical protein
MRLPIHKPYRTIINAADRIRKYIAIMCNGKYDGGSIVIKRLRMKVGATRGM